MKNLFLTLCLLMMTALTYPQTNEYILNISESTVNFTGKETKAMTINGTIPGPTLTFQKGDWARIIVSNQMDGETSIHWHGILLPNDQDGVPYLTTVPIEPKQSLTFQFPIIQSGTYWYHSHTMYQEQQGVYGPIVIHPQPQKEITKEYVLVFSDWTDEDPHRIMRNLKKGSDYYSLKKGNMPSTWGFVRNKSFGTLLKQSWDRMPPMDISDIAYDAFLVNGQKSIHIPGKPGDRIKLRMINAAASTYFYIQSSTGSMQIISADGVDVRALPIKRLLMAVAETYDVVLTIPEGNMSYELRATSQDGSGYSSIKIGEGHFMPAPDIPKPNLYSMDHQMDMKQPDREHSSMANMEMHHTHQMDHTMDGSQMKELPRPMPPYQQLKSITSSSFPKKPDRHITLKVTGDMQRYVWTFDNKILKESDNIKIRKGEIVRITFDNETMMHHPMHLHGHFFRLITDDEQYSPWKHTVDVAPMQRTTIEFLANEEKDWFLHCHILYHMEAGMARVVSYEGTSPGADILKWRQSHHNPLNKDPWYSWADISVLQSVLSPYWTYSDFSFTTANTRNIVELNGQGGWNWNTSTEDIKINLLYNRYFTRFFTAHLGFRYESTDKMYILGGIKYQLPLRFDFSASLLNSLDLLLELEKEIVITPRFHIFGNLEYIADFISPGEWDWTAGAQFLLSKSLVLIFEYDSTFSLSAGLKILL